MMKASVYHLQSGTWTVEENHPLPLPEADEIRVKVLATALNPVDAKVGNWKGMLPPGTENIVLGLDVCGQVDAVGSDVSHIEVGDYVLYHGRMFKGNGGFAEYAIHDALTAIVLGKELPADAILLAATPCAAWTAHRALYDKLHIPRIGATAVTQSADEEEEEKVLCIVGASGGVGCFALQLAKLSGVKRIIAVCSKKNFDQVMKLGATDVIDYREESIYDGIQRLTNGQGVDWILDCVGAATAKDAIRSLKFDGLICPIVSFAEGDLTGFLMSHVFCQVSLGAAHGQGVGPRKRLLACGKAVTDLVLQGKIEVPVTKVISLEEVGITLQEMLAANNTGKIVLKM
jgi:NADPH:quinone reductase-like Zn-dependent oxidoreductase